MHDAIAAGRDASADQSESHLQTFEYLSDTNFEVSEGREGDVAIRDAGLLLNQRCGGHKH
jgi:hypothetical protein